MPLLVLDSAFSPDSRILRKAAQSQGWDTLRVEGLEVPEGIDVDVPDVAIFASIPAALRLANAFERTLLGCDADWLPLLPFAFRKREIVRIALADAMHLPLGRFMKSALSKHLAGKVWEPAELRRAADGLVPGLSMMVAEPVEFQLEYRCFVADRAIETISAYRRFEAIYDDSLAGLGESPDEIAAALEFAVAVMTSGEVPCPPAFVLDVGWIADRGWAVVEANPCWASGLYYCDPVKVLKVLQRACIPKEPKSDVHKTWDFGRHYAAAVDS